MLPKRRNPTHPGEILMEEFLMPLDITIHQFARTLGDEWNDHRVKAVINGEEGISQETARRFAEILETSPDFWIHLQRVFDEGKKT